MRSLYKIALLSLALNLACVAAADDNPLVPASGESEQDSSWSSLVGGLMGSSAAADSAASVDADSGEAGEGPGESAQSEYAGGPARQQFVAWGTSSCGLANYKRVYAGLIHVAESYSTNQPAAGFGLSNLFCAPADLSAVASARTSVQYFQRTVDAKAVPCAVCVR